MNPSLSDIKEFFIMKRLKIKKSKKKETSSDSPLSAFAALKTRKKIILLTIAITIIMLSVAVIVALMISGVNPSIDDKDGQDDDSDYHGFTKNHFASVISPEYSNNYTPVLVQSDALDYLDNVTFRDGSSKTINHSQIDFTTIKIYPVEYFSYNTPILPILNNVTLSGAPSIKETQLRVIFDLSNFTIQRKISFTLNMIVQCLSGSNLEITTYKNYLSSSVAIENNFFTSMYYYKSKIIPFNKKILDLSFILRSLSDFTANISSFIELSVADEDQEKLYLVNTKEFDGFQEIVLSFSFCKEIKINGILTNCLNLTFSTIIDVAMPHLDYLINPSSILYNITDQHEVKGSFSYCDKELKFNFLGLGLTGKISIENVDDFKGVFVINDNAGNLLIKNITYIRDAYQINLIYPNFTKDIVPVIIESNCSDYINIIQFYDRNGTLLHHTIPDLEDEKIFPTSVLVYNTPINLTQSSFMINSSLPYNKTAIRLIFDLSNYSIQNNIDYNLSLSLSRLTGDKINITLIQNNSTFANKILSDTFHHNFNFSSIVFSKDVKHLDFILFLNSLANFSINISGFIIPNSLNSNLQKFYLIRSGINNNGLKNITVYFNFTETLKVNDIVCKELNMTLEAFIDSKRPVFVYQLAVNSIKYYIEGESLISGTFSYFNQDDELIIIELTSSGTIIIEDDVNYFKGIFIVQDIAGNLFIINVTYDRLLFPQISNQVLEEDDKTQINDSSDPFLFKEIIIIILIISSALSFLIIFYKIKNRKKYLKDIVVKEND